MIGPEATIRGLIALTKQLEQAFPEHAKAARNSAARRAGTADASLWRGYQGGSQPSGRMGGPTASHGKAICIKSSVSCVCISIHNDEETT